MSPLSSAPWPPMSSCPGSTGSSPTSNLGARRLPRPARQAPPSLPRRVRLSLQPTPNPPRRLPLPARPRQQCQARHIQHADRAGAKGISLLKCLLQRRFGMPSMRPKVLVTGGAGFVGSHICEQLLLDGKQIVIVDVFNTETSTLKEKRRNIEPCLSGCNPHPLYVGCAVIRQARVSEWKLMF